MNIKETEYVNTLKEYILLLGGEINKWTGYLHIHGQNPDDKDIEKGKELRSKIEECEKELFVTQKSKLLFEEGYRKDFEKENRLLTDDELKEQKELLKDPCMCGTQRCYPEYCIALQRYEQVKNYLEEKETKNEK